MWNPYVKPNDKIKVGEVERLARIVGDCIDNADGLDVAARRKWFGHGYHASTVERCIGIMQDWKQTTPRGLCISYQTRFDDLASSPLKAKSKRLIGQTEVGTGRWNIPIRLGTNWLSHGTASGDRLIALIHEMTHNVICTLDVYDRTAMDDYDDEVKAQVPSDFITEGKVYYGMKNVFDLASKSSVAAVLNAENWAYFLAEARGNGALLRFLSMQSERDRTAAGWGNYDMKTAYLINDGPLC